MGELFPKIVFDDFEDFWTAVPRKVGKKDAQKAYRLARKYHTGQFLKEAMLAYAKSREGEPKEFTLHPSTWLRGERWNDQSGSMTAQNGERPSSERIWADKVWLAKRALIGSRHAPTRDDLKLMIDRNEITREEAEKWPFGRGL